MSERHQGDAADRGRAVSSWLLPGLSAPVVRKGLIPGYVALMAVFIALSAPRAAAAPAFLSGQVAWLVVSAALARASWLAFRSSASVERRFWGLIFAAGLTIVASQLTFLAELGLAGSRPPLASISTVLDLVAVGFLVATLVSLTRFRRAMFAARARFVVDMFAACVVMVGVLADLVVTPLYSSPGGGSSLAGLLYSLYPVIGALALAGTLRVVIGTRIDRWQPWERLIGGASVAFAVALMVSPLAFSEAAGRLVGGWAAVAVDATLLTSLYAGFGAVVLRLAERDRPWGLRPLATIEPSYGWVASVVLPSIELLAIPAFGIAAFESAYPAERAFRLTVVATIALLLALRTVLAVIDSETLLTKADTDPLTGLLNHRLFYDRLGAEMDRSHRHLEPLSLIAIDIDDFGSVNSLGGHLAGDSAIVRASRAVSEAVRVQDVVCRVGGDELMVILPGADPAQALLTTQRILDGIRRVEDGAGRMLTASAGVASFPRDADDRDALVSRADAALYWAKRHGKNRAVVFDPHVVGLVNAQDRIRDLREHANVDAVRALAAAVDARDPGTQDHSLSVAALATALAKELGLDEQTVQSIGSASLLHDVGKIGVPDAILHKTDPLTAEERFTLRTHAVLGAEILSATAMSEILPWVRHHHERWDGRGFPDGLAGEEIPLGARIIAVCEAYDSLITGRPGRKPLTPRAALQVIDLDLGVKYDPVIGERFLLMVPAAAPAGLEERVVL